MAKVTVEVELTTEDAEKILKYLADLDYGDLTDIAGFVGLELPNFDVRPDELTIAIKD